MTSRAANSLLAVVLAVLASVGVAGFASATPGTLSTPSAASVLSRTAALSQTAADCGDTSGFTQVDLSSLPREAGDTVEEIKAGGPYP
ncbi:MAG: hypothetical protein ACRDQ5_19480, partial [Sciscionella sp.]